MNSPRIVSADIRIAIAIALYILLLAVLPHSVFLLTFSEQGPFEQLSILAWIFAALVIVVRIRPLGPRAWALALNA
jgi:hypothetical protein